MTQPSLQYNVRDAQGNIYGPATIPVLRQWIGEGRIVSSMQISEEGSGAWQAVGNHPELADLFRGAGAATGVVPPSPYQASSPVVGSGGGSPVPYHSGSPTTNGMAIASLVLGIINVCGIGSILAIIFGIMARKQIRESNGAQTGEGLALAGIIIGAITLGLNLVGCCIWSLALSRGMQ